MDHLQQLSHRIRRHLWLWVALENLVIVGLVWAGTTYTTLKLTEVLAGTLVVAIALSLALAAASSRYVIQPLQALWQAVLHLSPTEHGVAAPDLDKLRLGQELVSNLTAQIYQLANTAEHAETTAKKEAADISHNFLATTLPLPLFILDNTETVRFANEAAAQYVGIAAADLIGKNIYMILDMSFPSEDTFDKWLKDVKLHSATSSRSWERVRLNVRDNHPTLLFDMAAYYNKNNAQKLETMLILFDHTKQYSQDDQAMSFIALSVHELRTPLTLLRGYIEVFEEELADKVDAELADFMLKMRATAQQLMAFVNNILNVARIDDDQLELQLQSENWASVLKSALDNLSLRAKVRGITLQYAIAPKLPAVGIDRLSIYEVINNLIDNAIKYSGASKTIKVDAHLMQDGMIETTIQDFGGGIPASVMPNLFTKFYRDHHNRAQIGGTGLGLYLSKAIVTAHGGNMWVRSKEGEGSTFGFTVQPYDRLAKEAKAAGSEEIVRGAHGWIKNHSLYRR